jgi:fumarate reductase subunit C
MKNLKYIILLIVPLFPLTSCSGGGGGIDIVQLTKNPIVMVIIGIIVLIFAFKMKK